MTFGAITTRRIRSGFYALLLHEAGLIQSSPLQLIAKPRISASSTSSNAS